MLHKNRSPKTKLLLLSSIIATVGLSSLAILSQAKCSEKTETTTSNTEVFRKPMLGEVKILPDATIAYTGVERYPIFKGNMNPWLAEHQQLDKINGHEGRTVIAFVVNATGKVVSPYVLKSSGDAVLDNEAMRLVSNLPEWDPATLNSKPVPSYNTLTISFNKDGIRGGGC